MSDENKTPANQNDRTTKNAEPTQHYDEPTRKEIERYNKPSPLDAPQDPFPPVDREKNSGLPTFLGGDGKSKGDGAGK